MSEQLDAPDHVLASRLSGTMSGEDIERYRKHLHEKLKKHERIGVCLDFTGLSDMEGEALSRGLRADLDFLAHLGRFGRLAFVSEKQWPHAVIGWTESLLHGEEAKVFTPEQRDQALGWAAEVQNEAQDKVQNKGPAALAKPSIRTFPTTEAHVLGFEWNGTVDREALKPALDEITAFLEQHEKVRLLNRVKQFGFNPNVFFQSGLLSMKLAAIQKVERYAIVGAPGWIEKAVGAINPLFPDMDVRTFSAEKETEAWEWLGAKPKE